MDGQDCTALEYPIVLCSDYQLNLMRHTLPTAVSLPPPVSGQGGVRSLPVGQTVSKEFTVEDGRSD